MKIRLRYCKNVSILPGHLVAFENLNGSLVLLAIARMDDHEFCYISLDRKQAGFFLLHKSCVHFIIYLFEMI